MRNTDFCLQLKRAECPVKVAEIVEKTIRAVYPHYYPSGAVQFFLDLHNEQRIKEALAREDIYSREQRAKWLLADIWRLPRGSKTPLLCSAASLIPRCLQRGL